MKRLFAFVALTAVVLSASAQDASHTPGDQARSMDTGKNMMQMQENMKRMQKQMEDIQATSDPKARQNLMQAHMQSMQENMKAMRGMMMGATGGGQKPGPTTSGDLTQRQDMMEKRMDMMQMMMEQMMQHDQRMGPMPAK